MVLQLHVIGHIGQDATVSNTNGKDVVNFSVAHTESYKNAQGVKVEKTTWVSCSYWDGAKVAPYLKKGTIVHLLGTPTVVPYTSKAGENKADLRLSVQVLKLISSPTPAAQAGQQQAAAPPVATGYQDEPPF